MFQICKDAGENGKKTSTRDFFKLSKKNLSHGCFHNLATFCKWFSGESKGMKTTTWQETQVDQIFQQY